MLTGRSLAVVISLALLSACGGGSGENAAEAPRATVSPVVEAPSESPSAAESPVPETPVPSPIETVTPSPSALPLDEKTADALAAAAMAQIEALGESNWDTANNPKTEAAPGQKSTRLDCSYPSRVLKPKAFGYAIDGWNLPSSDYAESVTTEAYVYRSEADAKAVMRDRIDLARSCRAWGDGPKSPAFTNKQETYTFKETKRATPGDEAIGIRTETNFRNKGEPTVAQAAVVRVGSIITIVTYNVFGTAFFLYDRVFKLAQDAATRSAAALEQR